PSVGFCLLLSIGVRLIRLRIIQTAALAALFLFMGYETIVQSRYWATDWDLARRGIEIAPNNYLAQYAMALELHKKDRQTEAIQLLKQVLGYKRHYRSLVLLGECYEKVDLYGEAEQYERQAIELNTYDPAPRLELGYIKEQQGLLKEAEKWIRDALRLQIPE